MRYFNKLSSLLFAGICVMNLASCESEGIYNIGSPDWLSQRVDSIAADKGNGSGEEDGPVLENMKEDFYTIGKTDYSSGWWADFSKYYVIPDGQVWNAVFNLNINPKATNTYKNFALIVCSDADRGSNKEYGAIRFDHQPSGNSEWGDLFFQQYRNCVESTLTFETDTDSGVEKLGGKVTLTIDRSDPNAFSVKITNGKVTKTMNIKEPLPNFNDDETNTNIRAFLVVEGSFIEFQETNIEPIGGCTSKEDKQPLKMTLNNVPDQALQTVSLEEAFASITATVEFEQGVIATVPAKDLIFQAIPDYESLGMKTLIVMYNKTFKGELAATPIIATAEFELVDKLSEPTTIMAFPNPVVLGLEDNSTPWWAYFTENIKVERRQTVVVNFTNYSSTLENWHNFCVILNGEALNEYAVVRADNFGWGNGYAACTATFEEGRDWDAWRAAMDGAKVTVSITNNSNGTADIKAEMLGNDGVLYTQEYIGINTIDKDDLYFRFVCEGSHLVFDSKEAYTVTVHPTPAAIGADDNSTPWWTEFTDNIKIEPFQTVKSSFTNYTSGLNNWNNFCVILNGAALNEYCVVRADNYGWGAGYADNDKLTHEGTQGDWATWLAAMNGAEVTVAITNKGNGMADIDIEMEGNDGVLYEQYYHNILVDAKDLYFRYVVDGSHLVFK